MPMDGLTVGFAVRELNQMLAGGRIDRINQPERDLVVMLIRAENQNRKLLLCASPNNARCHLTNGSFSNPLEPPAFCMLMRKQLTGGRIISVSQAEGDRIVHVDMDTVNELGDHVGRRLVLEIMGRHSNLILLDENGRILEAARHVTGDMNRVRQIQPGLTYAAPPSQHKLNPETITGAALEERLRVYAAHDFRRLLRQSLIFYIFNARRYSGRVKRELHNPQTAGEIRRHALGVIFRYLRYADRPLSVLLRLPKLLLGVE